jgi:nucleoside-diphosphate-sugar epimerase
MLNPQLATTVVLGGTGFLGFHLVNLLKEKDHIVRVPKRTDLRVYENVLKALEGADIVFHFAADMGGVGYFSKANYYPFINNMQMDLNVVRACEEVGVKRLFYASSACAYPPSDRPLSEDMLDLPADPDQMYGWEKLTMIKLLRNAPFDARVGILHTIFGEGQEWQGEKAKFPPTIVYKALMAQKTGFIEIWGDGTQTRTFQYVTDAINKIYEITIAEAYYGEVNISSDEIVTVTQCAEWVCEELGIKPEFRYQLDKPTGVLTRGVDNSKFKKHYTYRDQVTTKEGFAKLTAWIKKQLKSSKSI